MGTRLIGRRSISAARRRQEYRTLAAILCAVVLPLILAFILVAMDMRTELSDLIPAEPLPDHTASLIGWQDLEIPNGKTLSLEQTRWQPDRRVRMLGYMMDNYGMDGLKPLPDGAFVRMFVLMPEAGHFLHPAHRIPDQMVEVWPSRPVVFRFRSLIWSTGNLARKSGSHSRMGEDAALYAMADADVQPAVQSDITLWFRQ